MNAQFPVTRVDIPRLVLLPREYTPEQLDILVAEFDRAIAILDERIRDKRLMPWVRKSAINRLRQVKRNKYLLERERARRRAEQEEGE